MFNSIFSLKEKTVSSVHLETFEKINYGKEKNKKLNLWTKQTDSIIHNKLSLFSWRVH